MRSNKIAFRAAMNALMVHKWRRAPFGSGRFLKECRETLRLLMDHHCRHPVLVEMAPSIARDTGRAAEDFIENPKLMAQILTSFCRGGIGGRVETRRWYTKYLADEQLESFGIQF